MKAALLEGVRTINLRDLESPRRQEGKVLVRVMAAGICGSDLHVYRGEFGSRIRFPVVPGHEIAGVIEEVWDRDSALEPGMHIVIDPVIPCRRCPACRLGRTSACRRLRLLGIDIDGGFAEYVVVESHSVLPVPESLPFSHAALVEPYAIGLHAVRRAGVQPGEVVVIYGSGRVGLSILEAVRASGVSQIIAIDINDFKLEKARTLGATRTVNIRVEDPVKVVQEITGGNGADRIFEAVGKAQAIEGRRPPVTESVEMLRPAGRLVVLGQGPDEAPVFWKGFVWKEAEIVASRVTLGEFPQAIKMLSEGRFHPDILITHTFALREVSQAYELLDEENPSTIKIQLSLA